MSRSEYGGESATPRQALRAGKVAGSRKSPVFRFVVSPGKESAFDEGRCRLAISSAYTLWYSSSFSVPRS